MIIFTSLLFVIFILYKLYGRLTAPKPAKGVKPFNSIPGPAAYPIIGAAWNFLPWIGNYSYMDTPALEVSRDLKNKYGNFVRLDSLAWKRPNIYVFDPDIAAEVYKSESEFPHREVLSPMIYFRRNIRSEEFGENHGLLGSTGEEWKRIRKTADSVLLNKTFMQMYDKPIREVTTDAMKMFKDAQLNSKEDLNEYLEILSTNWTFETLAYIVYGKRMNYLKAHDELDNEIQHDFLYYLQNSLKSIYILEFGDWTWKYFASPSYKTAIKHFNGHFDFIKQRAVEALEESKNNNNNGNLKFQPLIEKLHEKDEKAYFGLVQDFLLVGVDTTSLMSMMVLYFMAKHQDIQKKLRESLATDRTYLRACIKEAFRFNPPAAGNLRTTTKDVVINGYQIPKETDIYLVHHYMATQEKYFKNANEYKPERWTEDVEPLTPFVMEPFGYGCRGCVGKLITEAKIEEFVSQMITNFYVKWNGPEPKVMNATVNFFRTPYKFEFTRIKN